MAWREQRCDIYIVRKKHIVAKDYNITMRRDRNVNKKKRR